MFITFEGIEGSGKTSQAAALAEALRAEGPVLLTREPGGTPAGERIRDLLLGAGGGDLGPMTQLLLMCAARAQHVREVLRPALGRGETVICVRYSDSSRAYQGGGEGVPAPDVEAAVALATGGLEPDLTLLLDLPPEEGLRRRSGARAEGWNHYDERELGYHRRVREAYLEVARRDPGRVVIVDASRSWDAVAAEVLQVTGSRARSRT